MPKTAPSTAVPTQVTHPWKASIRTFAQALLSALTVAVVAWPIFQDFLTQIGVEASGFYAWTVGAGTVLAALAAGISRLMALPQLQDFLSAVGLGATPREETAGEQIIHIAAEAEIDVAVIEEQDDFTAAVEALGGTVTNGKEGA